MKTHKHFPKDKADCFKCNDEKIQNTPTPWFHNKGFIGNITKGSLIANTSNPADAEFIVRAVNAHEFLLSACYNALSYMKSDDNSSGFIKELLKEAIAKASASGTGTSEGK